MPFLEELTLTPKYSSGTAVLWHQFQTGYEASRKPMAYLEIITSPRIDELS